MSGLGRNLLMKLIVGLGNPGRRYSSTPHNTGYDVVDVLASRYRLKWSASRKVDAELTEGLLNGEETILLKPTTYMNLSGEAVAPLLRYSKADLAKDLLVVYDDVALPLGRIRIRAEGSSGGHHGMDSLIQHLRTPNFTRLRCGVGPGSEYRIEDLAEYVLCRWPRQMREAVDGMIIRAADAAERWITDDLSAVMNFFNTREQSS